MQISRPSGIDDLRLVVKILVAGQTVPWPEISGARIRLANVLRALEGVGEIDLFVIADSEPAAALWEGGERPAYAARVEVVSRPSFKMSTAARLRWMGVGALPLPVAGRDFSGVRSRFAAWAAPAYDLVWFNRAESYVALGSAAGGPAIVDLDDLEDRKAAGRLAVAGTFARLQARRDAGLWRRLQRQIAASVAVVTVCSEADRRHLGVANAEVIPNGYAYQEQPLGGDAVGDPPAIVFPGFLPYPPNLDAARRLVGTIAPLIWTRLPRAQIRLVGTANDEIRSLHRPPQVVVTGTVPQIDTELSGADLIAVPIRYGGGTRIKILEAFAHRIPVVSTSAGVEGIEAHDERELLVRDTPETFAEACARLLTDQVLRRRLVEAAYRVFLTRYRWDRIHPMIASLAVRVAAQGRGA
jgi:glycosyltransferase involved in cell wall biosynthesis